VVRGDHHVHKTIEADASDRNLERSHADAGRLDGEVGTVTASKKIQPDALLRIGCVRGGDCVEGAVQSANRVAEEEVHAAGMLEGVAQIGALQLVPSGGPAASGLMPLFILFPDQLLQLDRGAGYETNDRAGPLHHEREYQQALNRPPQSAHVQMIDLRWTSW
jgi:hypothetical protein